MQPRASKTENCDGFRFHKESVRNPQPFRAACRGGSRQAFLFLLEDHFARRVHLVGHFVAQVPLAILLVLGPDVKASRVR
jgi:hypothetical protein